MRSTGLINLMLVFLVSCMHSIANPVNPCPLPINNLSADVTSTGNLNLNDGPYNLWGEWTLYFNTEHDSVTAQPNRQARFHLNTLKFLENYCADCLQICSLKNNGNGTIDLTIRISHPFYGYPEYTGFDVKGIIIFNGSYEFPSVFTTEPPYPDPYIVSWRELGDPELLNPDGYTMRWSPGYESGSDLPMFNYWPGKYSNGAPNSNLNGFINFYTHEQRHMFAADGSVQKTYTIWLPPGEPVIAGYAVEACWAPPTNIPVTDPLNDFPPEANQPEPYMFDYIVNNNNVITESPCCAMEFQDCSRLKVACARWDGVDPGFSGNTYIYLLVPDINYIGIGPLFECSSAIENFYYADGGDITTIYENGLHRQIIRFVEPTWPESNVVLDICDINIQL